MTTASVHLHGGEPAVHRQAEEAAFRRQFEKDAVWSRMVRPGGRVPALPLIEVDLGPIHLHRLLDTGPLVLVFFPHAASPAGTATLAEFQRVLLPACAEVSAHLVAVSPQRSDRLAVVKHQLDLEFLVTSDPRHTLIDAFGIGYSSPQAQQTLGTRRSVLPYPTVVVADRTGTIRYADVHPESARHTPVAPIIAALRTLTPTDARPVERK